MIVLHNEQQVRYESSTEKQLSRTAPRSVSFDSSVVVIPTLHHIDFSNLERQACWYSKGEFELIKQDNRDTVSLCRKSMPMDEQFYCTRGLEFRTHPRQHEQSYQRRQHAVEYVLCQQVGHTNQDDFTLASTYKDLSYKNKAAAYLMAVKDARSARDCEHRYNETSNQQVRCLQEISAATSLAKPVCYVTA